MYKKYNIIANKEKGFSLVELSVVLVIIGVVVGIITAGVTIQKTSELRSIITQVDQFKVAIESFDDKYDDLPGDMSDAHEYWGANCDSSASNCNGDGDGNIDLGTGSNSESFRAWQHLSLSGMVDGEFTGVGSGSTHVPFENTPGTSRTGGGYHLETVIDADTANPSPVPNNVPPGTTISVGGFTSGAWPRGKFLVPSEALFIDNKTDDGDPDDGKSQSRGYNNNTAGCIQGTDPNRTYVKSQEDSLCIMFFDIR